MVAVEEDDDVGAEPLGLGNRGQASAAIAGLRHNHRARAMRLRHGGAAVGRAIIGDDDMVDSVGDRAQHMRQRLRFVARRNDNRDHRRGHA